MAKLKRKTYADDHDDAVRRAVESLSKVSGHGGSDLVTDTKLHTELFKQAKTLKAWVLEQYARGNITSTTATSTSRPSSSTATVPVKDHALLYSATAQFSTEVTVMHGRMQVSHPATEHTPRSHLSTADHRQSLSFFPRTKNRVLRHSLSRSCRTSRLGELTLCSACL